MATENKNVEVKKGRKWGWILICYVIFQSLKSSNYDKAFDEKHLFTGLLFLISISLTPILIWSVIRLLCICYSKNTCFIFGSI